MRSRSDNDDFMEQRATYSGRTLVGSRLTEVVEIFRHTLGEKGLFAALRYLNSTTEYRFTGIYRFEEDWVRSVLLFDRGNPHLRIGTDVPMKASYCMHARSAGEPLRIEDAQVDGRLLLHPARDSVLSYLAVHLLDPAGGSWGTLCHFDFRPHPASDEDVQALEAVRPEVQTALWTGLLS